MTPERMRQLAAEVVLDAARDMPAWWVRERLADLEHAGELSRANQGERERLEKEIHALAVSATVEVSWPDDEIHVGGGA